MTSINKKKLLLLMKNQYEKLTVPVTKDESIERGKGGWGVYMSEKRFVLRIKFCTAYEILLFVYS